MLPLINDNRNLTYIGAKAVVTGFGKFTTCQGAACEKMIFRGLSPYLRFVEQNIKACPRSIQTNFLCSDSRFLTMPCQGDSGAPLVLNTDGRLVLIGIVSFGECEKNKVVAYTRVDLHLSWIKDKTGISYQYMTQAGACSPCESAHSSTK